MDSLFSCLKRIDSGAILFMDDETGELKEIIARSRNSRRGTIFNYSRTIVGRVIREGKAVIMSDTSEEDKEDLSESILLIQLAKIDAGQ